jgi:ParB family chromosome partitioning protein
MAAKRKNALGRGLGALLDDSSVNEASLPKQKSWAPNGVAEIIINEIETNPFQPRTHFDQASLNELAESIRIQGIIQPITVRRLSAGKYQLIAGERRYQASKMAGLTKIPAYIRAANDQQMLEMALIENIQRENLNAIEIALSYQRLLSECDLRQEDLGERVGKNRSTVTNYLRLLKLPPDIQIGLRDKKISMGHARALISIENIDAQLEVYRRTISQDLSVRQVEALVKLIGKDKSEKSDIKESTEKSPELIKLQSTLASHFGTKVVVNTNQKNKGEIKIPFISVQDLNRILEILDISL